MDPATVAGLGLAVVPLIIAALENYEYTFQPIIIFSRGYRREVERLQQALKVQRVDFANECCWLLHSVTSNRGNVMINDPHHVLWQDEDLENRLRTQLADCYDACGLALSLINVVLSDILKDTKTLDILTQKKTGKIDIEWLKRLRQRSKISFSKDRYDEKLRELERHIDSLHRMRKHAERIAVAAQTPERTSSERVEYFRVVQSASSRLYEVLESHWKCRSSELHFANICLDFPSACPRDIHFDLAWSCPGPAGVHSEVADSIRLSIEACPDSQRLNFNNEQFSAPRETLESVLEEAISSASISANSEAVGSGHTSTLTSGALPTLASTIPDLYTVPDLCHHLTHPLPTSATSHCIGFLQKTKTFKHVIYAPRDKTLAQNTMRTLQDALQAVKGSTDGIPLPEKLGLAKLLASAVLRYHSTPWLNPQWQSQDVVFFNIRDFTLDPLRMPFLRSSVRTCQGNSRLGHTQDRRAVVQGKKPMRSYVRNQTLFNLGVMLIELAYNSPFIDLQAPEDDQGDSLTYYWAAGRLGESVRRILGQKYADAVKICLHCGFGPSDDLDDPDLQNEYFTKVVQKLEKCAEAVAI